VACRRYQTGLHINSKNGIPFSSNVCDNYYNNFINLRGIIKSNIGSFIDYHNNSDIHKDSFAAGKTHPTHHECGA
jgi:hypothetical protein